jgi:hypothetical protein
MVGRPLPRGESISGAKFGLIGQAKVGFLQFCKLKLFPDYQRDKIIF